MKWSIGFLGHSELEGFGSGGESGFTKAQWFSHLAPSLIHFCRVCLSLSVSCRCASGGGMISSGSLFKIRKTSSLSSGLPEAIAGKPSRLALASSSTSNLRLASRVSESGPWQVKQASERMGRTSRLKLMFCAVPEPVKKIKVRRVRESNGTT